MYVYIYNMHISIMLMGDILKHTYSACVGTHKLAVADCVAICVAVCVASFGCSAMGSRHTHTRVTYRSIHVY